MKEQLAQTQLELEEVREAVIGLADSIDHLATKEEVGIAYKVAERRRKRWTTAILVAGALFVSVALAQWSSSNATAHASRDRAQASCSIINGNKKLIRDILALAAQQPDFPGLTPAQKAAIDANQTDFAKRTAPLLVPIDCQDFAKNPEKYVEEAQGLSQAVEELASNGIVSSRAP